MKKLLWLLLTLNSLNTADAQTLFTYGNKEVSKSEFLKAFNKNPNVDSNREASLQEYLKLYINFKLKVQAAYDEKLNEKEEYKQEAESFKKQLIENRINEEANIGGLLKEAFERSQKDVEVAQVFVEIASNKDTADAYNIIIAAMAALGEGKDFSEVAQTFSTDTLTQKAKGNIGFITVFTLPYTIETIIYSLQNGAYSRPYRSNSGYHIFKKISERPALGKRKIKQILLPVPATFSETEKEAVAQAADSIFSLLKAGASFDDLASQDNASEQENGVKEIEVGVGEYDNDFETRVFSLQKTGDVSSPFVTDYGYHIIKLLEILPVSKDENDIITRASLQKQVENDTRLAITKKALLKKWCTTTQFKEVPFDERQLWAYTDSFNNEKAKGNFRKISKATPLFKFAKKTITVNDWLTYVSQTKQESEEQLNYSYDEMMKTFKEEKCQEQYKNYLLEHDSVLSNQIKEFNEANLLFSVMDKYVWSKSSDDSIALKKYYNNHLSKYEWTPGISAIIITTPTLEMANEIAPKIKNDPADWRAITASYEALIQADSSRFEQEQIPVKHIKLEAGYLSDIEQNETDSSYSFIYITKVFPDSQQRDFEDAKGMVINDYQQVVEEKWLGELEKKYPVKVNEEVFKSLK